MNNKYWIGGVVVVVVIILGFVLTRKTNPVMNTGNDNPSYTATSTSLTDGTYNIDTELSTLKWNGDYMNGSSLGGNISLSSGNINIVDGVPTGGSLEIMMPMASSSFSIIKIIPSPSADATTTGKYIVDGNLTFQGVTKEISFPLILTQSNNRIVGDSYFALNKSEWTAANTDLRNAITVELHIEASKK